MSKSPPACSQNGTGTCSRRAPEPTLAVGVVALALGLYVATLCPSAGWGDPAKHALQVATGRISSAASDHLLRNLVGHAFEALPAGDTAWRQNLVSAVAGALSCGLLFLLGLRLTGSSGASFIGACALAVSHTHWWLAVVAEHHAPALCFLFGSLLLLLRWEARPRARTLFLLGFLLGLSLANDLYGLLLGPFLLAYLLSGRGAAALGRVALAAFAGGLLAGVLPLGFLIARGGEAASALDVRMLADWRPARVPSGLALSLLLLVYQFAGPALLLGFVGLRRMRRRACYAAGAAALGLVLFASGYMPQRQPFLIAPAHALYAVAITVGAAGVLGWFRATRRATVCALLCVGTILAPVVLYAVVPRLVGSLPDGRVRRLPGRDEVRWFLVPWKQGAWGPRSYALAVAATAGPGALVVKDFTPGTVLAYYRRVEGIGRDIDFLDEETGVVERVVREALPHRPVFLCAPPSFYGLDLEAARTGPLWRVGSDSGN